MDFGNPIVGGEDLIRSAIKSPDFSTDPESGNVTGWRIARDGTATFYNLVIGSEHYNIDENGNAVFQSVSASEIFLNGENLSEALGQFPRGVIAVVTAPDDTGVYNGTPIQFNGIKIPVFDSTRQYEVGVCGRIDMVGNTGDYVGFRARYAWDANPTSSSTILFEQQVGGLDGTSDWGFGFSFVFGNSNPQGTEFRIRFEYFTSISGVGTYTGTNWGRSWVADIGPVAPVSVWTPSVPPVQKYTKTYVSTNSNSFQSDGDNRGIAELYQGYWSSTNGNQFSLIQFNDSQIRADLAGSVISKVELYLNNNHFYANAGGDALIGTHNETSVSGNHPSSDVLDDRISTPHFDLGQAKWVTIPTSIGNALRDNTRKGIALGPASSNSNSDYAYFAGIGQSGNPQLRITYTK